MTLIGKQGNHWTTRRPNPPYTPADYKALNLPMRGFDQDLGSADYYEECTLRNFDFLNQYAKYYAEELASQAYASHAAAESFSAGINAYWRQLWNWYPEERVKIDVLTATEKELSLIDLNVHRIDENVILLKNIIATVTKVRELVLVRVADWKGIKVGLDTMRKALLDWEVANQAFGVMSVKLSSSTEGSLLAQSGVQVFEAEQKLEQGANLNHKAKQVIIGDEGKNEPFDQQAFMLGKPVWIEKQLGSAASGLSYLTALIRKMREQLTAFEHLEGQAAYSSVRDVYDLRMQLTGTISSQPLLNGRPSTYDHYEARPRYAVVGGRYAMAFLGHSSEKVAPKSTIIIQPNPKPTPMTEGEPHSQQSLPPGPAVDETTRDNSTSAPESMPDNSTPSAESAPGDPTQNPEPTPETSTPPSESDQTSERSATDPDAAKESDNKVDEAPAEGN